MRNYQGGFYAISKEDILEVKMRFGKWAFSKIVPAWCYASEDSTSIVVVLYYYIACDLMHSQYEYVVVVRGTRAHI